MKKCLLIYSFLQFFLSLSVFSQNVIQNGDFEIFSGPLRRCSTPYFTSNELPGWNRYTGTPNIEPANFAPTVTAFSGNRFLFLANYKTSSGENSESAYTDLNVKFGGNVVVKFYLRTNGVNNGNNGKIELYLTTDEISPYPLPVYGGDCIADEGPHLPDLTQLVGSVYLDPSVYLGQWQQVSLRLCNVNRNYTKLLIRNVGSSTVSTGAYAYIDKVEAYVNEFTVSPNLTICPNQSAVLHAFGVAGAGWCEQGGSPFGCEIGLNYTTPNLTQTKTYTVSGSFSNGCPSQQKTVTVNVIPGNVQTPTVTQTQAPLFCVTYPNKHWYFHAESPGASSYNFSYKDINNYQQNFYNTNDIFISAGGNVGYYPTVTVTANNGCATSPPVTVIGKVGYNNICYPLQPREGLAGNSEISSILNGNQLEISNINQENMDVSVYSVKGNLEIQKTSSEQSIIFDTKTLIDGVYFIRIVKGNNIINKKIVIVH